MSPPAPIQLKLYLLVGHVQHRLQPLAVLLPGLLLVDLVAVALRQPQEPPDGAQVLPQRAVLRARALLPAQELAQPALVGTGGGGGGGGAESQEGGKENSKLFPRSLTSW